MIYVPCNTCLPSLRRFCRVKGEMHRLALMAHYNGAQAPDCSEYQPHLFRGIDGVMAFPRAPLRLARTNKDISS